MNATHSTKEKLDQQIRAWISQRGLEFVGDDRQIRFVVPLKTKDVEAVIFTLTSGPILYIHTGIVADQAKASAAAVVVGMANSQLPWGSFDLDPEDGMIFYRHGIFADENGNVEPYQLDLLVSWARASVERYIPVLSAVADGVLDQATGVAKLRELAAGVGDANDDENEKSEK